MRNPENSSHNQKFDNNGIDFKAPGCGATCCASCPMAPFKISDIGLSKSKKTVSIKPVKFLAAKQNTLPIDVTNNVSMTPRIVFKTVPAMPAFSNKTRNFSTLPEHWGIINDG
uniref:Uncharacterized protein n=1 Tax=Romanomermis culicivorax TaxID=13658 RepID=A0A915IE41_ROMCU